MRMIWSGIVVLSGLLVLTTMAVGLVAAAALIWEFDWRFGTVFVGLLIASGVLGIASAE